MRARFEKLQWPAKTHSSRGTGLRGARPDSLVLACRAAPQGIAWPASHRNDRDLGFVTRRENMPANPHRRRKGAKDSRLSAAGAAASGASGAGSASADGRGVDAHGDESSSLRRRSPCHSWLGAALCVLCAVCVACAAYGWHISGLTASARDAHAATPQTDDSARGDDTVAVRASGIRGAGLGAFARRAFAKGELIGTYVCKIEPHERNLNDETGLYSGAYSWSINLTHACDAELIILRNPMRYLNSIASLASCSSQNTEVVINVQEPSPVSYFATRDVRAGEELFVDYSEVFFKGRPEIGVRYECGVPRLHRACGAGNLSGAQSILAGLDGEAAKRAKVNVQSPLRLEWTPLMEVALYGHVGVARLLIHHGARVDDTRDTFGRTALYIAAQHARTEMVGCWAAAVCVGPGGSCAQASLEETPRQRTTA